MKRGQNSPAKEGFGKRGFSEKPFLEGTSGRGKGNPE